MHLLDKIEADRNSWPTVIFIFLFGIYAEKLTEIFLVQSGNLAVILLAVISLHTIIRNMINKEYDLIPLYDHRNMVHNIILIWMGTAGY